MRLRNSELIFIFLVIDITLLTLAYTIQGWIHFNHWFRVDELFVLLQITWIITYIIFLDRGFFRIENVVQRIKLLITKYWVFLSLTSMCIILYDLDDVSRAMFLGSSLIFLAFKVPASYLYTGLIAIRQDSPSRNRILVVGADKVGMAIKKFYESHPYMGTVIGFLDNTRQSSDKGLILGRMDELQEVYDLYAFNEVIITIDLKQEEEIRALINSAEFNGVRPAIVANYYSIFNRNFELRSLAGIPLVNVREVPLDTYINRMWKRTFDLVFSIFALLLISPLMLLIALAIKLDTRGPVFYKPTRLGRRGARIRIFKFRSMVHTDKNDPKRSTAENDERITRVGKFIRKFSLDELPQFMNVLKGDMSVVGPRPHRLDLNKRFQQKTQNYLVRHYIKPGITGWAQVNGWRGPTESRQQYIARTLHDLWYIEHWNLALDIYIILLTIFGNKTRRNAF
jgi:putative colanic acid biosysnthesis UDP-glucose lipid carrier transferase